MRKQKGRELGGGLPGGKRKGGHGAEFRKSHDELVSKRFSHEKDHMEHRSQARLYQGTIILR